MSTTPTHSHNRPKLRPYLDAACEGAAERRHRIDGLLLADRAPHPDWQISALDARMRRGHVEPPDYSAHMFGRYRAAERIKMRIK